MKVEHESGPALRQYWIRDFLPATSIDDAVVFLNTHGRSAIVEALPAALSWAAPLAAVGLLWLLIIREWRWMGAVVLLVFGGLLGASALQLYPIGQEFRGRIDIFSYAPTTVLVVLCVHAVTRWLPLRSVTSSQAGELAPSSGKRGEVSARLAFQTR